jgi:hypothetical protein
MNGLSRDDQRRIAKGKIVHIPTHRPLFGAQGTAAETLMVALTAFERTVEEHNQPRTITHSKHASTCGLRFSALQHGGFAAFSASQHRALTC